MLSAALRGAKRIVLPVVGKRNPGGKCDEKEAAGVQGRVNQLPRQDGTCFKF